MTVRFLPRVLRYFSTSTHYLYEKMSVFTQIYNPLTGKVEWEVQREDYDYQQEVARSAYADMLHDWERNLKYHKALKSAIDDLRKKSLPVRVLDIGTGSGLLAMMAAKYGADYVHACEAFLPVADCAEKVLFDNKLEEKIQLIRKRSTQLTVGPNGDLPERANILVTEVFDTELIGEGALSTFKHALENLLVDNCIVIPSSAVVYAQVIQSSKVTAWHRFSNLSIKGISELKTPETIRNCPGAPSVHDIQLSQLNESEFKALTQPIIVKKFDFTKKESLIFKESSLIETKAILNGLTDVVFMWWSIEMYPGGDILSCAPTWAHPDGPHNLPWRDHWMQAVYYLPKQVETHQGENFCLGVHHDEYSFWFSAHTEKFASKILDPPICACGVHTNNSRSRVAMMNDSKRYSNYVQALSKVNNVHEKRIFVCGESVPLAIIAAKMGYKKVYVSEPHPYKSEIIWSFAKCNGVVNEIQVIAKEVQDITEDDFGNSQIDVVLAEPYFSTSVLQWDNMHYWHLCSSLKPFLANDALIIPQSVVINAVAANFKDLWKIRAPVNSTEGFDLSAFDKVIQGAIDKSDANVEPQPLWEYPCLPVTKCFQLCKFNFKETLPQSSVTTNGTVLFEDSGPCNGIALWTDFVLDEENVVTLGPMQDPQWKESINWYRYSQQGVYIFSKPVQSLQGKSLNYRTNFYSNSGKLGFHFQVVPS